MAVGVVIVNIMATLNRVKVFTSHSLVLIRLFRRMNVFPRTVRDEIWSNGGTPLCTCCSLSVGHAVTDAVRHTPSQTL